MRICCRRKALAHLKLDAALIQIYAARMHQESLKKESIESVHLTYFFGKKTLLNN